MCIDTPKLTLCGLLLWTLSAAPLTAQLTSRVNGIVRAEGADTDLPLYASVVVLGTDPPVGAVTDGENRFSLEVPAGTYLLEVSLTGYETRRIEIIVRTGQTLEPEIRLEPAVTTLGEVTVTRQFEKNEPLDPLSFSGARSFSTEETFRFAGSLGDPARMARAYAGVMPVNDSRNDLIIRGNSGLGVQYRINGFVVPNPNHFNAGVGMTGGQVTMLNTNMMANSDFHLGAWPATMGNALSGIFDIRYHYGIRSNYQMYLQSGFNGLEAGIEGPLGRAKKGSFKAGYRYSLPDIMAKLGLKMLMVPEYQDFTLTATYDLDNNQTLSFLGFGGKSAIVIDNKEEYIGRDGAKHFQGSTVDLGSTSAFSGLLHEWQLTPRMRLENRISYAYAQVAMPVSLYSDAAPGPKLWYEEQSREHTLSLSSDFKASLPGGERLLAGVALNHWSGHFRTVDGPDRAPSIDDPIALSLLSGYVQYAGDLAEKVTATGGIRSQWLTQNGSLSLEPRFGIKYRPAERHTLSLSGGIYAMMQNHTFYFVKTPLPDGSIALTNHNLDFSKSAQISLAYDVNLAQDLNLKVEGYFQQLYSIPTATGEARGFSALNLGAGENAVAREDSLTNVGLGRNYGVEVTLEKYFSRNFYLLLSATLYRSLFTDGVTKKYHPGAFDGRYILNLSGGYELPLPKGWTLLFNLQGSYAGGIRYMPFDKAETIRLRKAVIDASNYYSEKYPDYARLNLSLGYRHSSPRWSDELRIELQNVTNHKNVSFYNINVHTGEVRPYALMGFMPMAHYRVYLSF